MNVYTTEEARNILRISEPTMYRLIKNGNIKPAKIGRQMRITEAELNRVLNTETRPIELVDRNFAESVIYKLWQLVPEYASAQLNADEEDALHTAIAMHECNAESLVGVES